MAAASAWRWRAITPDVRQQLNLPSRTSGAVVAQVQPGSAAEQAGLQAGDVVVGVANRAVGSPEEAVERNPQRPRRGQGDRTSGHAGRGMALFVAIPSKPGLTQSAAYDGMPVPERTLASTCLADNPALLGCHLRPWRRMRSANGVNARPDRS